MKKIVVTIVTVIITYSTAFATGAWETCTNKAGATYHCPINYACNQAWSNKHKICVSLDYVCCSEPNAESYIPY
jgi:hypothetical protein